MFKNRTFIFLVFVFILIIYILYIFYVPLSVSPIYIPNIEVLRSNKGFDIEISSSNMPPRDLYRINLGESNDKT